jgi:hypothetical protein
LVKTKGRPAFSEIPCPGQQGLQGRHLARLHKLSAKLALLRFVRGRDPLRCMDERYRPKPAPRDAAAPPHLRTAPSPSSYSRGSSITRSIRAKTAGLASFGGRPWASLPWATHSENHSSYEVKHCSEQSTAQEKRSLGRLAVSSPQKAHRLRTIRSTLLGEPSPRHTPIEPIACKLPRSSHYRDQ